MGRRHLAGHDHLISADERARCGPVNAVGRITHDKVAPLGKLYVDQISRRRERSSGLCVRSEEHTSELQSLMRISYAVFCLKKKIINYNLTVTIHHKKKYHIKTHD